MYNINKVRLVSDMRKVVDYKLTKKLDHIAFIMDGNGRWAKKRLLPRHLGHKEGCKRVIEVLRACDEIGIYCVSLYAFSTENWKRPQDEIDHLFNYLDDFFNDNIAELIERGIRVHLMGDIKKLPLHTQETIRKSIDLTEHLTKRVFNICLNYGGKDEITRAAQSIAKDVRDQKLNPDDISENVFEQHMMCNGLPPVDLMVRTSGEQRISNYMLWELAYAEMIFPSTPWPSFTKTELIKCLEIYQGRNRRFGGLRNE